MVHVSLHSEKHKNRQNSSRFMGRNDLVGDHDYNYLT